jgi:hypothetical protein
MITIKLSWWLGNQMFQYALWIALSKKYNTELFIDESFIKNRFPINNYTFRNYELDVFKIEKNVTKISKLLELFPILNKIIHPYFYDLINRFIYKNNYIKEVNWKYIENIWDNVYLDWYWQTAKYFDEYEKEIKEIFQVKTKISEENQEIINLIEKNYLNTVSVHIRRWDYVSNLNAASWHWTCNDNYYNKSINIIKEHINNPYFIVFSDDISWVKENMNFWDNVLFVEWNKWHDDLRLMQACTNHIIANSSFSWWWAYLWKNPNKIIIAPSKWLNNPNYDTSNILANNWIKI